VLGVATQDEDNIFHAHSPVLGIATQDEDNIFHAHSPVLGIATQDEDNTLLSNIQGVLGESLC